MTDSLTTDLERRQRHRMELFESLMFRRVRNILLVASQYDAFVFVEDGRLMEALHSGYLELNLSYAPSITAVSTIDEAIDKLSHMPFDLVINILRTGDMDVENFGRRAEQVAPHVPVLLLVYNPRDVGLLERMGALPGIDRVFVWLGDVRLFVAMIKYVEDRLNASHDISLAGVQCILLVEDNVRFYSAYLPILYSELVTQTQTLMSDAVNRMDKLLRMRARPKVLLASCYEEAEELLRQYADRVAGVVVDGAFPRGGKVAPGAGLDLARLVRDVAPDRPVLVQSSDTGLKSAARSLGAGFVDKGSISLLQEVSRFLEDHLGFGDFVFRTPGGNAVGRAVDVQDLVNQLATMPDESLLFHSGRNDFSTWLMARTEFSLAKKIRRLSNTAFPNPQALRDHLIALFNAHHAASIAGVVTDFTPQTFTAAVPGFMRMGEGSLGGKGRGLAFVHALLERHGVRDAVPGLTVSIPPTVVVATDVFDRFMDSVGIKARVLGEISDQEVIDAFLEARLPDDIVENLRVFLERVDYPLAVRSSSLLEDASLQPFAGIYRTVMIPNNADTLDARLADLERAVKLVYASVFCREAKAYIALTPNRLEEEKMAVIIQQVVGRRRGERFYPDMAGVARSHNFYPLKGMAAEDGVASVVLGLGKTVVEGGRSVRFSPRHPRHLYQFSSAEDTLASAQRSFVAMDLSDPTRDIDPNDDAPHLVSLGLDTALEDDVLPAVGSVYSPENDAIYDGTSRPGIPLVTLAGVLKADVFPLAEVLQRLLALGADGFSSPVEIEFAANIRASRDEPHEFAFLQIRPVVTGRSQAEVSIESVDERDTICLSHRALGDGTIGDIRDIIYVRHDTFDRRRTVAIAEAVGGLAARLRREGRPTLLIGPGRWGTRDRWLGIPVTWHQIAGVRCIVETEMADLHVEPSQGTHFFQNITSFGIGYFSINRKRGDGSLDVDWLNATPAVREEPFVRHLAFDAPLEIIIQGRRNVGLIMKPGCTALPDSNHRS